jgi:hypothetical protein
MHCTFTIRSDAFDVSSVPADHCAVCNLTARQCRCSGCPSVIDPEVQQRNELPSPDQQLVCCRQLTTAGLQGLVGRTRSSVLRARCSQRCGRRLPGCDAVSSIFGGSRFWKKILRNIESHLTSEGTALPRIAECLSCRRIATSATPKGHFDIGQ